MIRHSSIGQGLGTALITPFTPQGAVDYPALDRLLDRQISARVDYLVVLGTTGEAVTLTADERREVRQHIAAYVRPANIPLVLGVGGNCTAQVISDIHAMHDELIGDYAAILSVCPYYNKPNQEGLFRHFTAIAKACPIPIILYNVPGRTGVNLLPETVIRIYEALPNTIAGIKEASGNIEQIQRLIRLAGNRFSVISGDDALACQVMQAGGQGLISVASNAFPEDFLRIVHQQDEQVQARYAELISLLFREGNPVGIKALLELQGICSRTVRLPLAEASEQLIQDMHTHLSVYNH